MNPPISPKTILIVDDEPLVLETISMLLGCIGHTVETATDGESALEKLAIHPFDIVFTDLGMPKMPGDVLAKAIKKQSPQQIVVMLTGCANSVDLNESESDYFDFTLSKPFQIQELRDLLQKADLKQTTKKPEFDFVCKQDWLTSQRHLHQRRHADPKQTF